MATKSEYLLHVWLTGKAALGPEVGHGEPQDGEAVQFAEDVGLEGQQRGDGVQLPVEALSVALRGVALRLRVFAWGGLQAATNTIHHFFLLFKTIFGFKLQQKQ